LTTVTGLAWDCGAVTTGPVTVPIVLSLGIGVASPQKSQAGSGREMRKLQAEGEEEEDLAGFGVITFASLFPVISVWTLALLDGGSAIQSLPPVPMHKAIAAGEGPGGLLAEGVGALQAVVPLASFLLALQVGAMREVPSDIAVLLFGLGLCLLGMWIFKLGLAGGLVPLGEAAGTALPKAVERFGLATGTGLILTFGFLAGAVATFSEPGLAALGDTVEKLTKGKFPKLKLVSAVALGVGLGIMLGMAKVFFNLQLWPILLVGYSLCLVLTQQCEEEAVVCIAWDSAGVTTGPITVPVVLASGLSLGVASGAEEGFGILSCASIGPIMSVLITGILQQRAKKAEEAQRVAAKTSSSSAVAPQVVGVELSEQNRIE